MFKIQNTPKCYLLKERNSWFLTLGFWSFGFVSDFVLRPALARLDVNITLFLHDYVFRCYKLIPFKLGVWARDFVLRPALARLD